MTFPLALVAGRLEPGDLSRYSTLFTKTVFDFFPLDAVQLFPLPPDDENPGLPEELAEAIAGLRATGQPVVDAEQQRLLVPVWSSEELCGVMVGHGGDANLFGMPPVWLDEQSHLISREFYVLKQSCQDSVTGLLNGFHLQAELESLLWHELTDQGDQAASLALLEVYPRSRDADRSLQYIVRAGCYLDSLLGEEQLLHHLGAGIFGLLIYGVGVDEARDLGDDLLRRLKREDFASAHLGITAVVPHDPAGEGVVEELFNQAWRALGTARKRGPFGLCAHATEADVASYPLKKTPEFIFKKLSRQWRGRDRFTLVLVSMDQEPSSNHFSKRVRSVVGQDVPLFLMSQQEAFIFLDNADQAQAEAWLAGFRAKMEAIGGSTFSMGVATYPYHNFKKSEIPVNCRKALVHTAFFGPDSTTFFDPVSLNISGDVYFNEGDLARAVLEYRRGLALDPVNLNLLNSLGVASVQLNRAKAARGYFEKALALAPDDFMALFNLAFVCLNANRRDEALSLLERALAVDGDHSDLLQHLGILYYQQGQFAKAHDLLARCAELVGAKDHPGGEQTTVARWLGRVHEALGDEAKAMGCYQQAVSGNPRDAGSLSRLGRLYALAGQGDDIALSLCRQAVKIDGAKAEYWFRLGWLYGRLNDFENAVAALDECLRLARRHPEAALLLGRAHGALGATALARKYYQKALRLAPERADVQAELAALD
ncbi:MAG: tetratricopeptide repeat protein [Desulfobulbaceae bacterium]|nr:tetratricopeptide repeat protein [Desulfobulbaceae bacterium]HIJ79528.1 tetratricopeptide repeat protein [Deltaproteobacteria bacterium]